MTTNDIIVYIGIAIISTVAAYIKIKITKFENTYKPQIEQINKKIQSDIGQQQYDKDVQTIKNLINNLDINKQAITLDLASELIKQLNTKVSFNESEILDIITKIIKGVL